VGTKALLDQAAEKGVSVSHLQRSALVPLELALFSDDAFSRLSNAELLVRVLVVIRHPSAQSGPR
jgi:hypothetical protein